MFIDISLEAYVFAAAKYLRPLAYDRGTFIILLYRTYFADVLSHKYSVGSVLAHVTKPLVVSL